MPSGQEKRETEVMLSDELRSLGDACASVCSLAGSAVCFGSLSQCKSRRNFGALTYCTSNLDEKKKKRCRKKFCGECQQAHKPRCASSAFPLALCLCTREAGRSPQRGESTESGEGNCRRAATVTSAAIARACTRCPVSSHLSCEWAESARFAL